MYKSTFLSFALFTGTFGVAQADVLDCSLHNVDSHEIASVTIYSYDGKTHSVFLELVTNYGDTMPYVFDCSNDCKMHFVAQEYMYSLNALPNWEGPAFISMTARSILDGTELVDNYQVKTCAERLAPTH